MEETKPIWKKLMCLNCEYFTFIDIEQAEAYPWCDAHNKRVLPTDYCQYFKKKYGGEMTTNEEKAKEIAIDYADVELSPKTTIYEACIEMAEWKDRQFKGEKQALIDKACEWLRNVTYFDYGACMFEYGRFIKDFKKAMEEK